MKLNETRFPPEENIEFLKKMENYAIDNELLFAKKPNKCELASSLMVISEISKNAKDSDKKIEKKLSELKKMFTMSNMMTLKEIKEQTVIFEKQNDKLLRNNKTLIDLNKSRNKKSEKYKLYLISSLLCLSISLICNFLLAVY